MEEAFAAQVARVYRPERIDIFKLRPAEGRRGRELVGSRPICVDERWINGTQSWTAARLDGGLPCPVFHRVGRVLRASEHGGGIGFSREAADKAAAATEMDSPD